MRSCIFATIVGALVFGFTLAGPAHAHGPGRVYAGFGNGAHDFVPHWHGTNTPFGTVYWYGNGLHDYLPHNHSISPWGGVRSYSPTPFGPTKSYNGFPYYGGGYFAPGYGGFYGSGW